MAGKAYIASTVPAKAVWVSSTTYFHLAAADFNDAMRWIDFAKLNQTLDPWIPGGPVEVLIPPVTSTDETGIASPVVFRAPPAAIAPPTPITSGYWTDKWTSPSGVYPSIVLDFVNNIYFDGVNTNAALTSLVNNATALDANGLNISGQTNITSNGAFTTAIQQPIGTIMAETIGGNAASAGIVSFTSGAPDAPIMVDSTTTKIFASPPNLLAPNAPVSPGTTWPGINRSVSGWDGSGRRIAFNNGYTGGTATAADAFIYTGRGQAVLGSYNNAAIFSGHIRRIAVWPVKLSANEMLAVTWPSIYLFPFQRYHMLKFAGGTNSLTLPSGALQYDRTQPWTMSCEFIDSTGDSVIFTNLNTTSSPFYGYQVWVPSATQKIRVQLMSGWTGSGGANIIQVEGSTVLTVGVFYRIMVSYDGSGSAAGIQIYVNGVAETKTITFNAIGTTLINTPAQFFIGSQFGFTANNSWIGSFQMSNILRSSNYASILNSESPPALDSNHVLFLPFIEGTGTVTDDQSSNNFTVTLSSSGLWNVW